MTKPTKWVCAKRRLRSAWASAQSDQSLRCALNGSLRTQGFFMRTAKTLIRLDGCPGWSESSLGAHSLCWFCHVAAHLPDWKGRLWNILSVKEVCGLWKYFEIGYGRVLKMAYNSIRIIETMALRRSSLSGISIFRLFFYDFHWFMICRCLFLLV